MKLTIAELAGQLGMTTHKTSTACRSLGFDVIDAATEIDLGAFNEAIARKRDELSATAPVEEEPYFALPPIEGPPEGETLFDAHARAQYAAAHGSVRHTRRRPRAPEWATRRFRAWV